MFAQFVNFDQAQHLAQDEAIGSLYLEGVADAADGRFPITAEITYLQGFCESMKQLKMSNSSVDLPQEEQVELPLVCGQCARLNNGRCAIKAISRNSSSYGCDRIKVDCQF